MKSKARAPAISNEKNGDGVGSPRQGFDIVTGEPFYEVEEDEDVNFSGDENKDNTGDYAQ
jgi:hypothetical protein